MLPTSLGQLLPYFKKYWRSYAIGSVCVLLQNGAAVLFPLVIKHAIDDLNHGVVRRKLLILASQPDEASAVSALDAGADDYVRRPFGTRELVARANAERATSKAQFTILRASWARRCGLAHS